MFGDPHLVTMDGLQYTFNGRGEFILVETLDQSFVLQGRMALPPSVTSARGTSFIALAMKQDSSPTVQIEISNGEVGVLIDGERLDFAGSRERQFPNVTVVNIGNETFIVRFASGVSIQASERNLILTNILVTVPDHFSTNGLLGQLNGDPADDLLPRDATRHLLMSSTIEDIHYQFGNTCKACKIMTHCNNQFFILRDSE